MAKLFLDTNILVSACQSAKGASFALIDHAQTHNQHLYVTDYVFDELKDVLTRNQKTKELQAAQSFIKMPIWKKITFTKEELLLALFVCPDPNDAPILAAATKAKVDALVSFDRKHLHTKAVAEYIGAPVITAGDALKMLRAK